MLMVLSEHKLIDTSFCGSFEDQKLVCISFWKYEDMADDVSCVHVSNPYILMQFYSHSAILYCFSGLISMEMAQPGNQILAGNHQLYKDAPWYTSSDKKSYPLLEVHPG